MRVFDVPRVAVCLLLGLPALVLTVAALVVGMPVVAALWLAGREGAVEHLPRLLWPMLAVQRLGSVRDGPLSLH